MKLVAVFVLIFVAGPLLFRLMTQGVPTVKGLRLLGAFVAALVLGGVGLRYGIPELWAQRDGVSVLGLFTMWLAWIGALAFGAQALRHADQGAAMRRWTNIIGALGTTVPWFGLAYARMAGA